VIVTISIDSFFYVLIIITLAFFAVQTIKHVRRKKVESVQSRSTIVIFVCLGLSYLTFFVYGSLKHALTMAQIIMSNEPGGQQEFEEWNARNANLLLVVFACMRSPAYCLIYIALIINIERWSLVLRESESYIKGLNFSASDALRLRRWMKAAIAFQILICLGWTVTECLDKLRIMEVKIAYYVYLGLLVQPALALCYVIILVRLKRYFRHLLENRVKMPERMQANYIQTDKELIKYFSLIL